ncbi:STAS domain-containing protein [Umezawaea endophytica]|uniref:Anti-sigma factor antagonist n=1 Tax=Umezawaea endophytica TaxID=1654476 RepID=A0A9X2VSL8_9PSEU|nr:STAS domain-containing protein [Umezawaea endophytica]MCS7482015.1 STAS domain-containing protein [Umezawaea endophytica]
MGDAMSTGCSLTVRNGGVVVLSVVEEVDMATAGAVRRALHDLLDERPDTLVLDLRRVAFFGSSGISALVGAAHRADRLGVRLVVATTRRGVLRALEITGAADLVAVVASPEQAVASSVPEPRDGARIRFTQGVG